MKSSGFTLVELLVVIAIIAVLAGMALTATRNVHARADAAAALSNLRQIGAAISSYTSDHNGILPGKLWPGQIPFTDTVKSGRLCEFLAGYLGIENPDTVNQEVAIFVPPAFRDTGIPLNEARTYVMNMAMPSPDGGTFNPWGSETAPDGPGPSPSVTIETRTWLLSDADQQHPRVVNASWKASTPASPIHGKERQALYSDGSASTVSEQLLR